MNDGKENIEKAIENINGVLMDFGQAVESLNEAKENLYAVLEKKEETHD